MDFKNLSDGTKDGFALFYMRDKKLCSVLLTEEQAQMLDIALKIPFSETPAKIVESDREEMMKLVTGEVKDEV